MSYGMTTATLERSFKQTVALPTLEGAAGIIAGIVVGDAVGNYFVTMAKVTGNTSLAVKGAFKFIVAGVSLSLSAGIATGMWRVLGTSVALGSIASFFIDLIAASPWAKSFGMSYVSTRSIRSRQTVVGVPPGNPDLQFRTGP